MKKRLFSFFFIILFGLNVVGQSVFAADIHETTGGNDTIVIGVELIPGYAYPVSRAEKLYEGYIIDFLNSFIDYSGYNVDILVDSYDNIINKLDKNEIDLIVSTTNKLTNPANYVISSRNILNENSALYVLDDADFYYDDFDKFNGIKVGFLKNNISQNEFWNYSKTNNFMYISELYDNAENAISALKNHVIDAIVLGNFYYIDEDVKNVATFGEHGYHFIGKPDKAELISSLDINMLSFAAEFRRTLMNYYQQYYWECKANYPSVTREQHLYYSSLGSIRVGYNKSCYPFEYTDANGKFAGVARGFFDFVSDYTGAVFSYREFDDSANLKKALEIGEIDLIASIPEFEEITYKNNLLISQKYTSAPLYKIFNEKSDNLGMAVNSVFILDRFNDTMKNEQFVLCKNHVECLDAVRKGDAGYTYINEYSWMSLCDEAKYSMLKVERLNNLFMDYAVAARNDEKGKKLVELFNISVNVIPVEMNQEILSTALIFYESNVPVINKFFSIYKYQISISVIVLITIIISVFVNRKKNKDKLLETLAYTDTVTHKPNYARFLMEVEQKIKVTEVNYAIGYFNLSNFKYINDFYGREQGDKVLCTISAMLEDLVMPDGMIARVTSDRFVFYMDCLDFATLKFKLETYLSNIEIDVPGLTDKITLKNTCGVFITSGEKLSIQDMVDKASIAEKIARDINNDSIIQYTNDIQEMFIKNQEMTAAMQKALLKEEFKVYLQPKVDMLTGKPIGAEALIRWFSPEKGFIPVNEFISLFEKNGFITEVDFFVLEKICAYIRERLDKGKKVYPINVNQSRLHVNDQMYVSKLHNMLNKYDVPMNLIVFEITESAFIDNVNTMVSLINRMKGVGFEFSMDDFGSGYSALNLLKDVPVDELKIDKGFLDSSQDTEKGRYIIEQIIRMAHGLDIRVVCEGVEREDQVEFLKSIDCDIAQGYYYAKPMPIEEFEEYTAQFEF